MAVPKHLWGGLLLCSPVEFGMQKASPLRIRSLGNIMPIDSVAYYIDRLSKLFALAGGIVLILLVSLTIFSVIGRTINAYGLGPIMGDFELVEHGTAFVVFCSLPLCQMRYGHVAVDILSRQFAYPVAWAFALLSQLGLLAVSILVSRQLYYGLQDKLSWGETSFILQLPVWWGYAAAFPATILWVITAAFTSWQVIQGFQERRPLL